MSFDPQRYAMEYHIIGFRECASEVARYLVTIEGMDIQDPLRLRLMSHLQCFLSQRELSAKTSTNTAWCGLPNTYQSGYNAHITAPITAQHPQQNINPHNYNPSSSYMLGSSYYAPDYSTTSDYGTSLSSSGASQNLSTSHHASTSGSNNNTSASPAPVPSSVESQQPQDTQQQPIYAELTSIQDKHHQNYNYENSGQSFGNVVNNNGYNNAKPYRPWHPDTMAAY